MSKPGKGQRERKLPRAIYGLDDDIQTWDLPVCIGKLYIDPYQSGGGETVQICLPGGKSKGK
jgi:hypothetical protein